MSNSLNNCSNICVRMDEKFTHVPIAVSDRDARGVAFREPPADHPFGVLAKSDDPDGNHFALLRPSRGR